MLESERRGGKGCRAMRENGSRARRYFTVRTFTLAIGGELRRGQRDAAVREITSNIRNGPMSARADRLARRKCLVGRCGRSSNSCCVRR